MSLNFPLKINLDNILLRKVELSDKRFIIELFEEFDIADNYAVAEDIKKDYGNLVVLWFLMMAQNEGIAWIIEYRNDSTKQFEPCGFLVSELTNSKNAVMISYALSMKFRKKGIISKSISAIEGNLSNLGISAFEAFVSERNVDSLSVLKKAGFVKYKKGETIDTTMIIGEDFKSKGLWVKDISANQKMDIYVLNEEKKQEMFKSNLSFRIWEEDESSDDGFNIAGHFNRKKQTGRFHFVFQSNVTEKIVGISNNESNRYNVPWELIKEEKINGHRYMIFSGWGDQASGGNTQFEDWKIAIDSQTIYQMAQFLMSKNPQIFTREKMKKVIGMENLNL